MIIIIFLSKFQAIHCFMKSTVLCNCGIEAEDNFLLESIATYPEKQSVLTMYYTVNTVFMHYSDSLTDNLQTHISENWIKQEQVFPISLQTFEFDSKLRKVPQRPKGTLSININKKDKY